MEYRKNIEIRYDRGCDIRNLLKDVLDTTIAFKQQKLIAWQPILTPCCVIPTLIIIGVLFLPFGYFLYRSSSAV
jgi:hypothetical protein